MAIYLITLTRGRCVRVSLEDIDLCEVCWHASIAPERGAKLHARNKKLGQMHRVIAARMGHDVRNNHIHHIDGDPLNNTRENLLVCSALKHAQIHAEHRRRERL